MNCAFLNLDLCSVLMAPWAHSVPTEIVIVAGLILKIQLFLKREMFAVKLVPLGSIGRELVSSIGCVSLLYVNLP